MACSGGPEMMMMMALAMMMSSRFMFVYFMFVYFIFVLFFSIYGNITRVCLISVESI